MALTLAKKQIPAIVGRAVFVFAAGWLGWQCYAGLVPVAQAQPGPAVKQPGPAVKQPGPAKAAAQADSGPTREKLIEDALVATGMKRQLDQLPQQLAAGVRQSSKQRSKASPAVAKAIHNAIAESFTAQGFHDRVSSDLKKNFDQTRLQALVKDFSAPAARRMVEREQAASSPEEFARFARSPAATRPSSQRAGLLKRIDAATRASDLGVDVAFSSMKAVASGVVGDGARKSAAVDKAIEKRRASTTREIRNATLLNLAFSFRDASDAELEEYARIYEAENSKWFSSILYTSLLDEVKSASARAGERIASLANKPAAPAASPVRSKADSDARTCLALATNTAIIRCAEQYR